MLAGALRLESEQIRSQGAGQLLGRVIESETVESLALSGGLAAVMAAFELALSAVVLALGAGGAIHVLLLAGWVAVTGLLCGRYARKRSRWTESRLQMTNDLVENMAGHRTRMVQSNPANGTRRKTKRSIDIWRRRRPSIARARGWRRWRRGGGSLSDWRDSPRRFFRAGPADLATTAVGLGGVCLAHQALRRMAAGLASLAGAAISWKQVAALFHAAARTEPAGAASAPAFSAM